MGQIPLAVPAKPVLLGLNGQPMVSPAQAAPPPRLTAMGFLRKTAEDAGGIKTAAGQAFHRVAGHMVKMSEEVERLQALLDLDDEARTNAAAKGIYAVASDQVARASGGENIPDDWEIVVRERPGEAQMYIFMAQAALGACTVPPLATDEEIANHEP